jgi:hypothetical protein
MKTIAKIILIVFVMINPVCSYAQVDQNSKAVDAYKQVEQEYASRPNDMKKLQSGIYELLKLAEAADSSEEANKEFKDILRIDNTLKADSKDRVRVMVHMKLIMDRGDVIRFIESSDGIVEETYQDFPYVLCKIHPKKLRGLASLSGVLTIKRNIEGNTQSIKR